jgi:hypothetical protein
MVRDCQAKLAKSEKKEAHLAVARKTKGKTKTKEAKNEETSSESLDLGKE